MSSTFGDNLKLSIFGQSHGAAIGMVLDGIPAGLPVNMEKLQLFLSRRAPGQYEWTTPRREEDSPEFLSGLVDNYTCGAPLAAVIANRNTRSKDYSELKDCPRPGHADYTAQVKYGGFQDVAGGGHFSGRLTAPLCIAGGLCKQWLDELGIHIGAHIYSLGGINDSPFDPLQPEITQVDSVFPTLSPEKGEQMRKTITTCKEKHDSIGGVIECAVTGLPAGIGEPMFAGIESHISRIIFGIPAVKGIEFGSSCENSAILGSESNDSYIIRDGKIVTQTNRCGGILGGISNSMPILFKTKVKPTPSISQKQKSISISNRTEKELIIEGRHDPCIVPRAVCVVEAATAIALYDLILGNTQTDRRK